MLNLCIWEYGVPGMEGVGLTQRESYRLGGAMEDKSFHSQLENRGRLNL